MHSYDENYISIMCLWAISLRIGIKQEISKAHTTSYSSFIASPPHGKYCPHSWASSEDVNEQMMIENIVAGGTRRAYIADSLLFARWCLEHQTGWLTANARNRLQQLEIEAEGMGTRQGGMHIKSGFALLLQNIIAEEPVILQNEITPSGFMVYLQGLRHWRTKERLSKSGYGNKRSAIYNLFRLHNGTGFSATFEQELSNLMRGFFRIIALENNDGLGEVREGKDPMTFQLYRLVSLWMIELGSDDGIWGHLFLVLTWNLMCRVNNTSQICLCHMEWADDAFTPTELPGKTSPESSSVEQI